LCNIFVYCVDMLQFYVKKVINAGIYAEGDQSLCSQPVVDSHESRVPLLSTRPVVTFPGITQA